MLGEGAGAWTPVTAGKAVQKAVYLQLTASSRNAGKRNGAKKASRIWGRRIRKNWSGSRKKRGLVKKKKNGEPVLKKKKFRP